VRLVDDDLSGVHADPHRQTAGQTPQHREGGVQRALRVVLQRDRRAERSHHGVARELLDRPAGLLDLLRHRGVEALEQRARLLGVALAQPGRVDEVGEEHGGDLPLDAAILA